MDAILNTQSASCGLAMKDIEIFADDSGGVCNLEVTSAPFSASIRFFFDYPTLAVFADNLSVVERSLSGEARLGSEFEKSD